MNIACFTVLILLTLGSLSAQTPRCIDLEKRVYALNNEFKYQQSQELVHDFLDIATLSNNERFHAYIIQSYTFKRLFDYTSVEHMIDSALVYGLREADTLYYVNNANCQKALMFFDIGRYAEADTLMRRITKSNYAYINTEYKAKLIMQEAFLDFLAKRFSVADEKYIQSLMFMDESSPCDKPMIYGKQLELFAATKQRRKLDETYKIAIACADSCSIYKYKLYISEMMAKSLSAIGDYKESARMYVEFLEESGAYQSAEHSRDIALLEKKFQLKGKEQELKSTKQELKFKQQQLLLLGLFVLAIILVGIIVHLWQKRLVALRVEQQQLLFTKELFIRTETERKRIASDLHDGVNNELGILKGILPKTEHVAREKITECIESIRTISRNLHPVLFEKVGLKSSVEQLAERMQNVHEIPIALELNNTKEPPTEMGIQVYRVIQEALTNCVKHAKAIAAKVEISDTKNGLFVQITDNGIGFNTNQVLASTKAFGLHNIIERATAIGGKATIQSSSDGTIITIEIPVE